MEFLDSIMQGFSNLGDLSVFHYMIAIALLIVLIIFIRSLLKVVALLLFVGLILFAIMHFTGDSEYLPDIDIMSFIEQFSSEIEDAGSTATSTTNSIINEDQSLEEAE